MLCAVSFFCSALLAVSSDVLKAYVDSPEANYGWKVVHVRNETDLVQYTLRLQSVEWLNESQVDRTQWWHWLTVVVPDVVRHDTVTLHISGGNDTTDMEDLGIPAGSEPAVFARELGVVAAMVRQVGNQPLCFKEPLPGPGAPGGCLVEDDLAGYALERYFETDDPLWIVRLPMVKSVKLAMDAVQDFLAQELGLQASKFITYGASKRGQVASLMPAVDHRVVATAPIVFDTYNVQAAYQHNLQCLANHKELLKPYDRITGWVSTEKFKAYAAIDDMYSYRHRYTGLPMLFLRAMQDPFFSIDSGRLYWDSLPAKKFAYQFPGEHHAYYYDEALSSLLTAQLVHFARGVILGPTEVQTPHFEFHVINNTVAARIHGKHSPKNVTLWIGDTPGPVRYWSMVDVRSWTHVPLNATAPGFFVANPSFPTAGWRAFFVELVFENDIKGKPDLHFTSPVRVTPDTYPSGPCPPEVCSCGSPVDCAGLLQI